MADTALNEDYLPQRPQARPEGPHVVQEYPAVTIFRSLAEPARQRSPQGTSECSVTLLNQLYAILP